jgi:hypothetical protein
MSSKRLKMLVTCANCGEPFHPFVKTGVCCDAKCAGQYNGKRRAERARLNEKEPIAVRGARWIPLGKGRFALVDQNDASRVMSRMWFTTDHGVATRIDNRQTMLHHFVTGIPSRIYIDHRNGDVLDNRKQNLRRATHATNAQNAKKHARGAYTVGEVTSKYKGVWYDRSRERWVAMISANSKRYMLGRFTSELDAAHAYDTAAEKLHGEFARFNLRGRT